MAKLGPIAPRIMLGINSVFVYMSLMGGGFPFEKFHPEATCVSRKWSVIYMWSVGLAFLMFLLGGFVLYGDDASNSLLCKMQVVNWTLTTFAFEYQTFFMDMAFTEFNICAPLIVLIFLCLSFAPEKVPITPRTMLAINSALAMYFVLLLAGALEWLPSLPFMGGSPFEKFYPNATCPSQGHAVMCMFFVSLAFLMVVLSGFALYGDDASNLLLCKIQALTILTIWVSLALTILAFESETLLRNMAFSEFNVCAPLIALIFLWLGFGPDDKEVPPMDIGC
jgi:Ni,Fe-hydrogenase I cytochrome b subunit